MTHPLGWLASARLWLRALVRRRDAERELDDEMRFHLDAESAHNRAAGMSDPDARRTALVAFRGVQRFKEAVRDERGTRWITDSISDVRFALRSLRRHRAFAITATLALAIGMGATTAVFSIANWLLLRPTPGVADPAALVTIRIEDSTRIQSRLLSAANITDLGAFTPSLSALAGYVGATLQVSSVSTDATPLSTRGVAIVGDYFGALGVAMQSGRTFDAAERDPAVATHVAVISDHLRRALFGDATNAVGAAVRINAIDFRVIGVAAPAFRGTTRGVMLDVWLPPGTYGEIRHLTNTSMTRRSRGIFQEMFGRLRPGRSPEAAEHELQTAIARLREMYPAETTLLTGYAAHTYPGLGLAIRERAPMRTLTALLLGVAGLVLLIACANVANLLLLRGVQRRGEIAIRRALGAGEWRLLRQHLVDGTVLAMLGALAGVVAAFAIAKVILRPLAARMPGVDGLRPDVRVLAFALVLALLVGLVFGFLPLIFTGGARAFGALRLAARAEIMGVRTRSVLVAAQVGMTLTLVIGALLFARTLINLQRVDLGFDPRHVTAFGIDPEPQGYRAERLTTLRGQLLDQLAARLPADSIALASNTPFAGIEWDNDLRRADDPGPAWPVEASTFWISPQYFAVLGMPMLAGRTFDAAEFNAPQSGSTPIIVTLSVARKLFGDANALGARIHERTPDGVQDYTVIGVVGDARLGSITRPPAFTVYQPLGVAETSALFALTRSGIPLKDLQALVSGALRTVDPAFAMFRVESLTETVERSTAERRLFARLIALLAVLGAALAAVGIYSLIAYWVAQRTREIGLRVALGADSRAIALMVMKQVTRLVGWGLAVGLVGAALATSVIESRLFQVSHLDWASYLAGGVALVAVTVLASLVPVTGAVRVNPAEALKGE